MELCATAFGCRIIGDATAVFKAANVSIGTATSLSLLTEANDDTIVLHIGVDESLGQHISTLVLRAQTEALLAECDRAVNDAIRVLD